MVLKDWKLIDSSKNYRVWEKNGQLPLVINRRTSFHGEWFPVFKYSNNGTSILSEEKTFKSALKFAKQYMRTH